MADISITAASFIPSANASLSQVVAGEAVTRGQTLYYDSVAGTYKLFDANDTAKDTFAGLACGDAATGQPLVICTRDPALALGGTIASGDTLWASATAGGITKTFADVVTGWRVYTLGVCNATGVFYFSAVRGGIK